MLLFRAGATTSDQVGASKSFAAQRRVLQHILGMSGLKGEVAGTAAFDPNRT
jgi:hypothetical protein